MSDRSDACLENLSKDLGDVLENVQQVKGENFRLYVTYIANIATVAKVMGFLKASSTHPDSEQMVLVVTGALAINARAFGDLLGLSAADREEALKTARTMNDIVRATNKAYDDGNKT